MHILLSTTYQVHSQCLPADAAKSLVNAFVVSRLDYCNSLYANLPQAQLDRIQSVFNGAAWLIFGASLLTHVTPLLHDRLHWLRCLKMICYKLCITVFKASHGMAPGYIADLCLPEVISERWSMLLSASTSAVDLLCQDEYLAQDSATGLFVWWDHLLGTVVLKALD